MTVKIATTTMTRFKAAVDAGYCGYDEIHDCYKSLQLDIKIHLKCDNN